MSYPPLTIDLFGPLRVLVGGEPLPRVRTRSVEWLLALLVLRHGRAVDRAWLAGTLWPESDERRALQNLRNDLVALRKALGCESERLQSPARDALTLALDGAEVDVLSFDAAIRAGDEEALQRAVALYTGSLLEGCVEEWVLAEREMREAGCLAALETLADRVGERGEYAEAVPFLRRAEMLDPLRDSIARRLMTSLAAAGDPGAAVEVYRRFRRRLHDELMTAPEEATTRLFQEIRARARGQGGVPVFRRSGVPADAGLPGRTAPRHDRRTAAVRRPPHPLSPLIGREEEVQAVRDRLRQSRLVTLVGAGGVGKTRLAIEVVARVEEEFEGTVAWVELGPLTDGALLLPAIAAALGIGGEQEADGEAMIRELLARMEEVPFLLALDNCEHLLDATAAAVETLLGASPELRVLATSRQRLGLAGEVAWSVPSLPAPEPSQLPLEAEAAVTGALEYPAVRLFVERAQGARPGFRFAGHEDVAAVSTICRRLDGIPLALELAAARVGTLTSGQIAARLNDRFALLTTGARTALPRQKTLRALIDWSYDLLTDDERALLRRLSVFAGGWTLEAAEAVCSDEGVGCWVLGVGKEPPAPIPNTQHPTPPLEEGQVLDLLTSLADKSLVLAEEDAAGLRYRMLETIREYAAERLRESGEEEAARTAHLGCFLRLAQEAGPSLRGPAAEESVAGLNTEIGNLRVALAWAQTEAVSPEAYVSFVAALWPYWHGHGSLFEGCEHVQTALDRCEGSDSPERAQLLLGAFALANEFHNKVRYAMARSRPGLGDPTLWTSDRGGIAAVLEQALAIQRRLGQRPEMVVTLRCLGQLADEQGDRARESSSMEEAVVIARELGNRIYLGITLHDWGCHLYKCGAYEEAAAALTEALALFRQPGGEYGISFGCNNLGMALSQLGDSAGASERYREGLAWYLRAECRQGRGELWEGIVWSLSGLARTGMREGEAQQAARLLGAVCRFREAPGSPAGFWDDAAAGVRAVLGEEAFRRALEAGRALSWEQAVADALQGA